MRIKKLLTFTLLEREKQMDTKEFMVIIKGQIKTSEIMSCVFNKDAQKWEVKYICLCVY